MLRGGSSPALNGLGRYYFLPISYASPVIQMRKLDLIFRTRDILIGGCPAWGQVRDGFLGKQHKSQIDRPVYFLNGIPFLRLG